MTSTRNQFDCLCLRGRTIHWIVSMVAAAGSFSWGSAQEVMAFQRDDQIRNHFHSQHQFRRDPRHVPPKPRPEVTILRFRTIDGSENNMAHPGWGVPGNNLRRIASPDYADGLNAPAGSERRSAREISNLVFDQVESTPNRRGMTSMVWQWGQFLDHDIVLTESAIPIESMPIEVPAGDLEFDPFGTGSETISFFRSEYNINTGETRPRQQVNFITAWIDGSNVYGSDEETAAELRTFEGGRLKTSPGDLLPIESTGFFLAGDIRANEQVGLTAMHTLFVREHNRIADRYAMLKPHYTDEQIYLRARRLVVAEMQAITVNEFLPALMGPKPLRPYRGYDPSVSPKIINEFATAAYRLGHSMIPSDLLRLDNNGFDLAGGSLALRDAFFNPAWITADGIEPYLMGLCEQECEELDSQLVDDLRNFLFGAPGAGGFDLAALNIQRGRDHGIPSYNEMREALGLTRARHFEDISRDPEVAFRLQLASDFDVDNLDAWVGMLSEDHVPNASVGPTVFALLRLQFEALRDGDRFWYQTYLQPHEVDRVDATRLSDVIRRNTAITKYDIRRNVFQRSEGP